MGDAFPRNLRRTPEQRLAAIEASRLADEYDAAHVEGAELPDLSAAKAYAVRVARELMRPEDVKKRVWRLDVCDREGRTVFVLPFAQVDPTLDHLGPGLRDLIERLCETRRRLLETIFTLETLALHFRAADARRFGKPYLARGGQRVDLPPDVRDLDQSGGRPLISAALR
jgi:hypothetical protein